MRYSGRDPRARAQSFTGPQASWGSPSEQPAWGLCGHGDTDKRSWLGGPGLTRSGHIATLLDQPGKS